jgi:hypothetical protein
MTYVDTDIWLYGSRARGDADAESDTDLLVISDNPAAGWEWGVRFGCASISRYSWAEITTMAAYGSLFLDHVKRDARRLDTQGYGADRFNNLLATLGPYRRAGVDLIGFEAALADCRKSLANGGWPDYELEVVATVTRHAALLGAYCAGRPDYGRESCFRAVGDVLGYDESVVSRLRNTYRAHRRSTRNRPDLATCHRQAPAVLQLAERFLSDLKEVIFRYEEASEASHCDSRGE